MSGTLPEEMAALRASTQSWGSLEVSGELVGYAADQAIEKDFEHVMTYLM